MSTRKRTKGDRANSANSAKTPPFAPQPHVAVWLRRIADEAEAGRLQGFAACAMTAEWPIPFTNIVDPTGASRLTLIGAVGQLEHMLHASEHNDRMASLAARRDPAS